jgi:two-component system, NtrC family, C4-dicarboxylate transport response regulator DctD
VLNMLMAYHWPGNVRELRNAAERYAIGMPVSLVPAEEPATGACKLSLAQQVDAFERKVIERSLAEAGGRISAVMEQLDIPRRTLSEKMARFGLDRRRFVDPNRQNPADEPASTGG